MLNGRSIPVLLATALVAGWGQAAEPLTLDLQTDCKVQTSMVMVANVAHLSGGDSALREQIAGLDLADMKVGEQNLSVTRRVVEYRLQLAGIDPGKVRIIGAERTNITQDRRKITAEEVVTAARTELLRWLTVSQETVTVELAKPVVVGLPEVPVGEIVTISASPYVKPVGIGRIQMHVAISTVNENLLGLKVDLEVKPINRSASAAGQAPANGVIPAQAAVTNAMSRMDPLPANPVIPAVVNQPLNGAPPSQSQPSSVIPGVANQFTPGVPASQNQPLSVVPAAANQVGTITQVNTSVPTNPNAILIHPRQRVTMLVHSGGLNVSTVGEAQQDGRLGQTIMVQNVDSKKMINARVTGPDTVEIQLDR
jgi:flagella basal body P-ring formation protein FlgA